MSEAAAFVPGQASLIDRTVDISPPAGSPFAGVMAPRKIAGMSVYTPSVSLASKPREIKIRNQVVLLPTLPTAYTHAYLTSVDPLEYETSGVYPTDALFLYKGELRLSYRSQSLMLAGIGPSLHVIVFKAQITILLRRSATEQFDQLQVVPLPAELRRLFPGSVFGDLASVFVFYFSWPNTRGDNVDIGLNNGSLLLTP